METKLPYHIIHKARYNERRKLSFHGKGFTQEFKDNLEKELGLTGTIERLKEIKKSIKNDAFKKDAKNKLFAEFATYK